MNVIEKWLEDLAAQQAQETQRLQDLALVRGDGMALKDIPLERRTGQLRCAAVKQNTTAVKLLTPDELDEPFCRFLAQIDSNAIFNCLTPAQRTRSVLQQYVMTWPMLINRVPPAERTEDLCTLALVKDPRAIAILEDADRTEGICLMSMNQDGNNIQYLTHEQRTLDVRRAALAVNGLALLHLADNERTDDLIELALRTNGEAIQFIPMEHRTEAMRLLAVVSNCKALSHLLRKERTDKICVTALMANRQALNEISPEEAACLPHTADWILQNWCAGEELPHVHGQMTAQAWAQRFAVALQAQQEQDAPATQQRRERGG